ncbi:aldo/keto reductase [Flavobacterium sp. Root420]|uniref:aldo/keto reductase n=1 Tax=Flavobacterium sp. Root420 TaxID=1736533 RepID=UPI0006F9F331|nr:aldo/keto reductase [Flavobacterium sp. Root420]KQX02889.1 aldo/keto reductase [Flavobacterium sp. Root420]
MKYKQLGNSGLIVSELCLGTMTFGQGEHFGFQSTIDEKKASQLVDNAIDNGINFFDTADGYGNGQSEIILGKVLNKKRKDVLITTKLSFRTGEQAFNAGVNSKHIIEQCHNSLKNLQTDYIDVLLLHNDDPITPIDETLKALENLVQQGKVRYIGFSNYQAWKAAAMTQRQKDQNYSPFVASQMHYSILNREVEREIIPMSLHYGIGMMVWSPLSSGFLTGKYTRDNPTPKDSRLNNFDLGLFDRELGYTVIDKLTEIAKRHNTTITAISLSWLLTKKVVSSVIIGVSKTEQLKENLACQEIQLSEKEINEIDELTKVEPKYPATFINLQDPILLNAKTK